MKVTEPVSQGATGDRDTLWTVHSRTLISGLGPRSHCLSSLLKCGKREGSRERERKEAVLLPGFASVF